MFLNHRSYLRYHQHRYYTNRSCLRTHRRRRQRRHPNRSRVRCQNQSRLHRRNPEKSGPHLRHRRHY